MSIYRRTDPAIRRTCMNRRAFRWGFSLLEVVIVVAIIAILAAIGIPRMSRGAKGASDAALSGDLAVLRNAIDLYATEHGGVWPSAANINTQLAQYTDGTGATNATKTGNYIYGPYLRSVPPLPVGAKKGGTTIAAADGTDVGWLYTESTGVIIANTTTETDDAGKLYNTY
jgi:prepilin-type N-terminal cleavage/methylation domain-containing protein